MILELVMTVMYNVFDFLTPFEIPSLPTAAIDSITLFGYYVGVGATVLGTYVDLYYLCILLGVILAVDIGISVYHFVMWVIRKIPFTGVS